MTPRPAAWTQTDTVRGDVAQAVRSPSRALWEVWDLEDTVMCGTQATISAVPVRCSMPSQPPAFFLLYTHMHACMHARTVMPVTFPQRVVLAVQVCSPSLSA